MNRKGETEDGETWGHGYKSPPGSRAAPPFLSIGALWGYRWPEIPILKVEYFRGAESGSLIQIIGGEKR